MKNSDVIDMTRNRPSTKGFKCSEKVEIVDGMPTVVFQCNLPLGKVLEFSCREPSCGALEQEEEAAVIPDEDYVVNPDFFNDDLTMAGVTGFKVWTGTRLLVETLVWSHENDCDRLVEIQKCIKDSSTRIVELGAGVGVVGTYLAAVGSQVMITDLPTLVETVIEENIQRNHGESSSSSEEDDIPTWLPTGVKIGEGFVDATPLNWIIPLEDQLQEDQRTNLDFIVASDVVFLKQMLESLLNTAAALFESSKATRPTFILSFQRRDSKDGEESDSFTTVDGILQAVQERGWKLECLAFRHIMVEKERGDKIVKEQTEVFVFEIDPW